MELSGEDYVDSVGSIEDASLSYKISKKVGEAESDFFNALVTLVQDNKSDIYKYLMVGIEVELDDSKREELVAQAVNIEKLRKESDDANKESVRLDKDVKSIESLLERYKSTTYALENLLINKDELLEQMKTMLLKYQSNSVKKRAKQIQWSCVPSTIKTELEGLKGKLEKDIQGLKEEGDAAEVKREKLVKEIVMVVKELGFKNNQGLEKLPLSDFEQVQKYFKEEEGKYPKYDVSDVYEMIKYKIEKESNDKGAFLGAAVRKIMELSGEDCIANVLSIDGSSLSNTISKKVEKEELSFFSALVKLVQENKLNMLNVGEVETPPTTDTPPFGGEIGGSSGTSLLPCSDEEEELEDVLANFERALKFFQEECENFLGGDICGVGKVFSEEVERKTRELLGEDYADKTSQEYDFFARTVVTIQWCDEKIEAINNKILWSCSSLTEIELGKLQEKKESFGEGREAFVRDLEAVVQRLRSQQESKDTRLIVEDSLRPHNEARFSDSDSVTSGEGVSDDEGPGGDREVQESGYWCDFLKYCRSDNGMCCAR